MRLITKRNRIHKPRRLLSAIQAKAIDVKLENKFGISTLALMENAGRAIALQALAMLNANSGPGRGIGIFCGKGNNGGDGFVAARHLWAGGIKADIFLAGKIYAVKDEAKTNLEILLCLKQNITEVEERNLPLVRSKISQYGVIIDALLGVGLMGEVRGIFRDLIGIINSVKARILSVDIPSGLDATTGMPLGCCVNADTTVTFIAAKRGMASGQGKKYCGRIIVEDLGVPLWKIFI